MRADRGFTLIELVAGMVVFSIVIVIVVNLVMSQASRSVDPVVQSRASHLAESLLQEIMRTRFDENSAASAPGSRCNEATPCTPSSGLGPDSGETRSNFDDVDDFHGLSVSGSSIQDSRGQAVSAGGNAAFAGFAVAVQVFYDDNLDGVRDGSGAYTGNVKLVSVTVTTPLNEAISFTAHRWNH
ncbi:prepilin-type N-terminal cleavage/methylation domain-containing protein [Alteromonas sp. ASW11-19]|uniref:Prepilin-type N-terminal cleavage/methylation domain-containing protein n=1 Tax=Alteromonas salexigens TaxID=2982530 RepID=A0ABT2VMZ3_9ALTE|nr:prepilin-type N-terminal cleavage/methylation domain-containing protein [Alteromonas salexigens]MCU7554688.1 prepilin-type N-terminal cleavage/methylation domain-containing protein [Alteromonas salexigens]